MNMADRVVCMNDGRIEQVGTPEDLYAKPASPFVANFIGRMNMLEIGWPPKLGGRPLKLPNQLNRSAGERICIRPEAVVVRSNDEAAGPNSFEGRLVRISFSGNITRLTVDVDGCRIDAERQGRGTWQVGDALRVELPPEALLAY
jgi:iron(III) transport system ATP-binding protein